MTASEAETADGYDDDDYESDNDEGLVHPLPSAPSDCSPSREKLVGTDELIKPKQAEDRAVSCTCQDESTRYDGEASHKPFTQVTFSGEVVRLHARRAGVEKNALAEAVYPPPAPMQATSDDAAVLACVQARKRVSEYQHRQMQKQERTKDEQTHELQARGQARRMFKSFNRSIGVADVAPSKRYEDAMRAKKREKKMKEQAVAEETANRWYRRVQRKSRSANYGGDFGAKLLEDARREHVAKLHQLERNRRAITKNLDKLSLDAKQIIAQNAGGYEHGSFLIKVAAQSRRTKRKTPLGSSSFPADT